MAFSPLDADKATVKESGITNDVELSTADKAQFIETQIDQYKQVIWRERVEAVICQQQMLSEDKAIAQESSNKNLQHQTMIKQFTVAIKTLQTLLKELGE